VFRRNSAGVETEIKPARNLFTNKPMSAYSSLKKPRFEKTELVPAQVRLFDINEEFKRL